MKQTCKTSMGEEQLCGVLAKQALERLVKGQDVTCKGDTRDRYKRLIAVCYVGPLNINEQMVVDGWALAYRRYSMDYVRAETLAKS
jgi:endonuclease YncB( thermonuclease family)